MNRIQAVRVVPMTPQHEDSRRGIAEAFVPDGAEGFRIAMLTIKPDGARLGDHYHPEDEIFLLVSGSAKLLTAPADNPEDITRHDLVAPCVVVVPAWTAHTFTYESEGVLLLGMAGEFNPDDLRPARLDPIEPG